MSDSATVKEYNPVEPSMADNPYLQLTRVFVYFLQNLFRDAPRGSCLRWAPDTEDTELIITAEKPTCDQIEKVPHISCILGSAQWGGTSMDQMQQTHIGTGRRVHTDLMSCSMNYHCQAKEGLVARMIAWNTSLYTNVFRRILQRTGGIHQIVARHQIGAESPPSAYTGPLSVDELVSVVVTVPFHWQVQWRIQKPAEVWRKINMLFKVNKPQAMYSAGRARALRPPMIHGRVVSPVPLPTGQPEVGYTQEVREDSYPET